MKTRISVKKILGPYQVDSLKTLKAAIQIRNADSISFSPVCYADSPDVQQVYKDWKKC